MLHYSNLWWSGIVTYLFPIGFFFYIWITIMCHGYMPSVWCFKKKDKHDDPHRHVNVVTDSGKQLFWFFFRMVFVFCLIWLPAMGMMIIGYGNHNDEPRCRQFPRLTIGLLFVGLQPIVSVC